MSFRLRWRGRGAGHEPVAAFAHRRGAVCWAATRGTVCALVYPRRDGAWGWSVGDYRLVDQGDEGETAARTTKAHVGVARSRRAARRNCLRVLRGRCPRESRP